MLTKDEIFNTAAELHDAGEQQDFLDQSCGSNLQLRDEIVALLHHDNASDSFLSKPPSGLVALIDTQPIKKPEQRSSVRLNDQDTEVDIKPRDLQTPTDRSFGEYEILEEIARGGMGVVYKARQSRLNRIVALKMILTGRLASSQDVQRFHTEAELAANLKHPNIVAIYDVGEQNHQHYFSMDYIEGDDLADILRGGPVDVKKAAEYVRGIAIAVKHAHEKGIIHRDLKPSNILIDDNNEPQITDFGLARRLESSLNITSTGQILGTPSYMAPEQVSSQKGNINETTDVYALGALLYELVCGEPPIRGETSAATLIQVLETEAKPPSHRCKNLPRDIDTIALKCLNKRQSERYSSAGEVAEELNRFLTGEPIRARKLGVVSKSWRLCRRKPVHAALSVVSLLSCFALALMFSALGPDGLASALAEKSGRIPFRVAKHPTLHRAAAFIGKTTIVFESVEMDPKRGVGSTEGHLNRRGGQRHEITLGKTGSVQSKGTARLPGVTTISVNGFEFHIAKTGRKLVFIKKGAVTSYSLDSAPDLIYVDEDGYHRHGKWPGNNPKNNPEPANPEATLKGPHSTESTSAKKSIKAETDKPEHITKGENKQASKKKSNELRFRLAKHPTLNFPAAYIGDMTIVFEGIKVDRKDIGTINGVIPKQGGRRMEIGIGEGLGGNKSTPGLPGITTICVNGYEFHIAGNGERLVFLKSGSVTNYALMGNQIVIYVDDEGYHRHGKWVGTNPKNNPEDASRLQRMKEIEDHLRNRSPLVPYD